MCENQSIQLDGSEAPDKHLEHTNNIDNKLDRVRSDLKRGNHSDDLILYRNKGNYALVKGNDVKTVSCNIDSTDLARHKEQSGYTPNIFYKNTPTDNVNIESKDRMYIDKTTFCRPVLNLYNEQFIFKTIEQNARIKNLVKKMIVARRREKETVIWSNFINTLKSKHGVNNSNAYPIHDDVRELPDLVDNFHNTNFNFNKQPRLCDSLLGDFYDTYDSSPYNSTCYGHLNDNKTAKATAKFLKYGGNLNCYPTSSQGRLMMMGKNRQSQHHLNKCKKMCDKEFDRKMFQFKTNFLKTTAAQTDITPILDFIKNIHKDKATISTEEENKNMILIQQEPDKTEKHNSLVNIENKLETLIESINTFLDEIKISKKSMKEDTFQEIHVQNKEEEPIPGLDKDNCEAVIKKSTFHSNDINIFSQMSDIFRNFDLPAKSYQVPFEEPTRDCCTEITKSFSNQNLAHKDKTFEKTNAINQTQVLSQRNMTIAVNTDPLSILALLRISSETFKNIVSYISRFNCFSYLSLLPIPYSVGHGDSRIVCGCVCNTRGAAKPPKLSQYIQVNNLGKTRNCSVCRHVLDRVRRRQSLFHCKYCGQSFTRAYCCELHQISCAKDVGRDSDASSDLLLLR